MRRVRFMYPLVATGAVAIGVALALVLPAGAQAAVQVKSPPNHVIAIDSTATLEANGAAVFSSLEYICPVGATAYLTVTVTQVVDNAIVSGNVSHDLYGCTGKPQALRVAVTPLLKPFIRGVAFGQASLYYYYSNGSRSGWDERTINIV